MIERTPIARPKKNILLPSALLTGFPSRSISPVLTKMRSGASSETMPPPTPEPIERKVERRVLPLGSSVITDASEPNGIFIPVYIIP